MSVFVFDIKKMNVNLYQEPLIGFYVYINIVFLKIMFFYSHTGFLVLILDGKLDSNLLFLSF